MKTSPKAVLAKISIADAWRISVSLKGKTPVKLDIQPPDSISVTAERYEKIPLFNPKNPGYCKGVALLGVRAEECSSTNCLAPASVVVKADAAKSAAFKLGKDYQIDPSWGTIGRLEGGAIGEAQPVYISYRYGKRRIDSIMADKKGSIFLKRGEQHISMPPVPMLAEGERRLANIYIEGQTAKLTQENIYLILEDSFPAAKLPAAAKAIKLLPKTMEKLRSGKKLRLLAWGDSVTNYKRWQIMLVERLRASFPKAKIELITEAWGGRNTDSFLAEPPGSLHNYQEKVLRQKPDLIISEFVNDAWFDAAKTEERYSKLQADFKAIGAEWIILTPHYTHFDWMGFTGQKDIDNDPRIYVKSLRQFAAAHKVALADASLRYGRLWRQGIPYVTLMENNINHPNVLAHGIFVDSLMALFD